MASQTASPSSAQHAKPKRTRCTHPGCRKLAPAGRKRCDDHKPGARPIDNRPETRKKLYGRTEPRLYTKPLRPLTRQTTRGYEVIDFAEMIGQPLLPWQQFAVKHALELLPDGHYRFRTVLIVVARQNGKSHLKRIVTLWRMYMDSATQVLGTAQDVALARDQMNTCKETIHACPELEAEWEGERNVNGDEWFKASGCKYIIKAANDKAGRGGSNDEVNIDELRLQHDWKAWAACSKTTNARANGQVWAMSNMGGEEAVVLNQLRKRALSGRNPAICLLEWSGKEGCELDDWTQLAQANPGLGYVVSEAALRSDVLTDPPDIVRTEILCQKVDALNSAIDLAAWKECGDPAGDLSGLRNRIAAVFDVAPDGKHATLAVAAKTDTGTARVEIAAAWSDTGAARAELALLLARIRPGAFAWYSSGPAAGMADVLRPLALKYNRRPGKRPKDWQLPEDGELAGAAVTRICMQLADLVSAHAVLHPGDDPLLNAHIAAATKLPTGDGWRFTRRAQPGQATAQPDEAGEATPGHVDAAYAAAGAVDTALTMPAPRRARIRSISA